MTLLLPLVAALVPLLIVPHFLFYFDVTGKAVVLLVTVAASFLLIGEWTTALSSLWLNRAGRWFCGLLGAAVLWLAVSTVFSTSPALSAFGTNWRRFGATAYLALLCFLAVAAGWLIGESRRVRLLLRSVAVTGSAIALYGTLQYFGFDPWLATSDYHVGEGIWTIVRPPGTLGHAVYLANYLLFVAFASAGLWRIETQRQWRFVAAMAATLCALAIVLSGTRAAMLGLVAGAAVLLVWERPRLRRPHVMVSAAIMAGLVLFYFSPAGSPLRARVHWSVEDLHGGARPWLWRDALRMATARPVAGWGLETFGREFPRFQSIELARAYPDFYHESPHNILLDAFTSEGAPGLLILLAIAGLGFWVAVRGPSAAPRLTHALAAGLAAQLLSEQFSSFTIPTALGFYITVVLLVALEGTRKAQTPINPRAKWAMAAPALAWCGVFAVCGVRLLVADRALALVKEDVHAGRIQDAIEAYQRVLRWQLPGTSADLYYSRTMLTVSQAAIPSAATQEAWRQALAAAQRAVVTAEDRQNAFTNLSMFDAFQNDAVGMERNLRQAIAASPNWFKPHWLLGQLLELEGRLVEAEAEARAAADRDGGKDPEVTKFVQKFHK